MRVRIYPPAPGAQQVAPPLANYPAMKPATHPTALRVAAQLAAAGIAGVPVEFEQPTRTSAEAAQAIGCAVAEIAKSVVLRRETDNAAVVVVAGGDARVSEKKVRALVGGKVSRADADFVKAATGYAIGGVTPVGLPPSVVVLLDTALQSHARVWAAAGTPFSVVPLTPPQLQALLGVGWADVRE